MSIFSERLKIAMERRGITQAQLSAGTGIPKSAISQYLSARFKPKQERVYILCRALDVDPAWLVGYESKQKKSIKSLAVKLSEQERNLISAYRTRPEIKERIDKILDAPRFDIFRAAKSQDGTVAPMHEEISEERLRRLKEAPLSDEDL